jgi:transketolase
MAWKMESQRKQYGKALVELGKERGDIVVLDADLSSSTRTADFAAAFPERFFNCGIAEQNMMDTAAGLAASGKTVFVSTFAVFGTGRCYDQIRQSIAYPKLNIKIVASHAGITVGGDGASHQIVEDIALMRVLPNMNVIVPADTPETYKVIKAVAKMK